MNTPPTTDRASKPKKVELFTSGKQGMRQRLFSNSGFVTMGVVAVAGYFLWTAHEAHVIAALPWLLIGGCLLMHLFMHRGHGGHGHGGGRKPDNPGKDD